MRSIYDAVGIVTTVGPIIAVGTASSTTTPVVTNGTTVDTKGYNTAMIHARAGSISAGNGTLIVTLQESADNSTWSNALDNTGTVIGFTLIPGTNQNTLPVNGNARIEGLGLNRLRYLRGVISTIASTTVAAVSTAYAVVLLGRAYEEPVRTAVSNT